MKQFVNKRFSHIEANSFDFTDKPVYEDLIDFSIGDPDQTTSEIIINGAFEDAKKGHTHYTNSSGMLELRHEIAKFQKEEYGLDIDVDEIFVTTSACHALFLTSYIMLEENDEVLIPSPHFSVYELPIICQKAKPVYLTTLEEEHFQINIDKLENLITKNTKAIVINTPNNPTGASLSRNNLEKLSKLAIKHNLLIIADDVYTLFSYNQPFTPIMSINGMKDRTITIRSFSKDFLMTGWRIGYIIADKDVVKIFKSVNDNILHCPPSISQRAAIHALRNRKLIQPQIKEEFKNRLYTAHKRIEKIPKLNVLDIQGTFYLFVNIKKTGLTSDEFCNELFEKCHILAISGNVFGQGEGYVRLSLTINISQINEAFDRIEKWLK